ncbi:MAG: 50S ribosomal protein L37ae [Fervidobacterium sp.]
MTKTKKIGSAGRYGVRYGRKTKEAIRQIEKKQKQRHECPVCRKKAVVRVAAGIWKCKKCNAKFAGGAYEPKREVKVVLE